MSTLKKDKQKVIGETLTEETLQAFLALEPPAGENADFHRLTRAYRGLPLVEFERFLTFYKAAGHELNPTNQRGETFIDSIADNASHQEYVALLKS